jgi:hypothetical protein
MNEIRCTLLPDGPSDRALLPLITWLLREQQVERPIDANWADLGRLPRPPRGLPERILKCLELYPCDLLCIHRDAEREPREVRAAEILEGLSKVAAAQDLPAICVVSVRITETWLLFDEAAIRRAAGNPNGRAPLQLPQHNELEGLPDPKNLLYNLLRDASGLHGRRRSNLPVRIFTSRVADLIKDFSVLRTLPAFQALECEIRQIVLSQRWNADPSVP